MVCGSHQINRQQLRKEFSQYDVRFSASLFRRPDDPNNCTSGDQQKIVHRVEKILFAAADVEFDEIRDNVENDF